MCDFQAIRPSNCRSERPSCRFMKIPRVCAKTFRVTRLVRCQTSRAYSLNEKTLSERAAPSHGFDIFGPVNFPVMARAGSASAASNPLIPPNYFSFTCLPHRSDHRKIYRRIYFPITLPNRDMTPRCYCSKRRGRTDTHIHQHRPDSKSSATLPDDEV